MRKKGNAWIETLVKLTLIFVVLLLLYIFLPSSIRNTGKELLDKIWGNENIIFDYEAIDKTAQTSFDSMITSIEACKNSKTTTDCLCSVNLNAFHPFYYFDLGEKQITLMNLKSDPPLPVKSAATPVNPCYWDDKAREKRAFFLEFETQGEPFIKEDRWLKDKKHWIEPKKHNLVKTSAGICWVSKEAPVTSLVACAV